MKYDKNIHLGDRFPGIEKICQKYLNSNYDEFLRPTLKPRNRAARWDFDSENHHLFSAYFAALIPVPKEREAYVNFYRREVLSKCSRGPGLYAREPFNKNFYADGRWNYTSKEEVLGSAYLGAGVLVHMSDHKNTYNDFTGETDFKHRISFEYVGYCKLAAGKKLNFLNKLAIKFARFLGKYKQNPDSTCKNLLKEELAGKVYEDRATYKIAFSKYFGKKHPFNKML